MTRRLGALLPLIILAVALTACSSPRSGNSGAGDPGASRNDASASPASGVDSATGAAPAAPAPAPAPATGGDSVDPSAIVGVWTASDGSGTKLIDGSGQCSGMYWNNGTPLDIGGPMSCMLGSQQASDGSYLLVVRQPPNQASYPVTFHGPSFTLISGSVSITLTRQ